MLNLIITLKGRKWLNVNTLIYSTNIYWTPTLLDREAWHAAIHGVAKSRARLSDWTELNPVPVSGITAMNEIDITLLLCHGGGNGNRLQYSCMENPMDRGAWWATLHGVGKKSDTTEPLNNNVIHKWAI